MQIRKRENLLLEVFSSVSSFLIWMPIEEK